MGLTRGERFQDARLVCNKNGRQTMDEVAKATGIAKSMIAALEADGENRSVGYDKVVILAKYYGVSLDWLLGLVDTRTTNVTARSIADYVGIDADCIEALHLYSHPEKIVQESKKRMNSAVLQSVFLNANHKKDIAVFSAQVMTFINKILLVIVKEPRSLSSHFAQFVELMKRRIDFEKKNGPIEVLELDISPQIVEDINMQGFELMPHYCAAIWHIETAASHLKDLLYKEINIELTSDIRKKRASVYQRKDERRR